MTQEQINIWLNVARWAPSGGNAQPWKVRISDADKAELVLSVSPEYRQKPSLMDCDGSAAVLALGTFAETLSQVVQLDGHQLEVLSIQQGPTFFDIEVTLRIVFDTRLDLFNLVISSLNSIRNRVTNRGKFLNKSIPEDFKKWMIYQCQLSEIDVFAIESQDEKNKLIKTLSVFEKVRWENTQTLADLFHEIETNSNVGIPFSRLGVSAPEVFFLKLLKRFSVLRPLIRLGISGNIAKQSVQKPLLNTPTYFYLRSRSHSPVSFFKLGRLVQRIWLGAQEKDMGFQPMEGHLLGYGALYSPQIYNFSPTHQTKLAGVIGAYRDNWGIDLHKPLFGFRLGYPCKVVGPSPRKNVVEIFSLQTDTPYNSPKKRDNNYASYG